MRWFNRRAARSASLGRITSRSDFPFRISWRVLRASFGVVGIDSRHANQHDLEECAEEFTWVTFGQQPKRRA